MITKILRYFTAAATRIHPQGRIPRHFEWQSEFLFLPEKRPLRPATPMPRALTLSGSNNQTPPPR
jgi:hypothetical protein